MTNNAKVGVVSSSRRHYSTSSLPRTPLRSAYGGTHPLAEARCIALQANADAFKPMNAMPSHHAAIFKP